MNDTPDDNDTASTDAEPTGPLAGERLAAAREELKITVLEVAKELHLDEPKVRALEKNEFDVLGAPVFAKGYLRKYAQLVGVSTKDVLADYYSLNRSATMPPVVGEIRKPQRDIAPAPWFAAAVIVIAAAFTYWFFAVRPASEPLPADAGAPDSDSVVIEEETASPDERPDETGVTPVLTIQETIEGGVDPDVEIPPATADQPAGEPDAGARPDAAPAAMPADGTGGQVGGEEVTLTIRFTGDCWTEITDASGERLFFELGRDGRVVEVTGEAPLSVLFGNADNVALEVDGDDFPIAAAARRGQTARLTIVAP